MALGVVMVVIGAMAAWLLVTRAGQTVQAVAVRKAVQRGAQITASDLMVVQVPEGTPLQVVPGGDIDRVAGKTAQVDLLPDQLLVPDAYGPVLKPTAGKAIVGVAPNLAPSQALHAGDHVRLVFTPPASGDLPETQQAWDATVVQTSVVAAAAGGQQLHVDVEIDGRYADVVTAASATGRLALSLVPGDQK